MKGVVLNDKSLLAKNTILSELRESNTQLIVNYKVLHLAIIVEYFPKFYDV